MSECAVTRSDLEALAIDLLPPDERRRLRAHVDGCDRCRTAMGELERALAPLRAGIALPSAAVRDRELARALRAAPAPGPAHRPRSIRRLALAVAAGAAAVALVMVAGRDRKGVFVVGGSLASHEALRRGASVPVDSPVDVGENAPALIRSPGRLEVRAAAGSRFVLASPDGSRWQLERGRLELEVAHRGERDPLRVSTPELTVAVVGTTLVVERHDEPGAVVSTVSVVAGVVEVSGPGLSARRLGSGESLSVPAPGGAPTTGEPASATPPTAAASPQPAPRPFAPGPIASASQIRRTIAAGRIGEARALIAERRATARGASDLLAELAVLTAEADLAQRHTRAALEGYLAVVRDFPASRQAEEALFAAAQLAIDEPGAGHRPELLLRDYLATYPQGKFRDEAQRILAALSGAAR